jgi:hypothetical protein
LMLGLDINYQILSYYKKDNTSTDILKYQYGYQGTLAQHFTKNLNTLNVGLRIGIYSKLEQQP